MEIFSGCAGRRNKLTGGLVLALLLGTTLFAPLVFGDFVPPPPPCFTGTLASFEGHSCLLEGYTLSNFTFPTPTSSGSPTLLTASEIIVNTSGSDPSHLNLQFSAAPGFQFHVDPGQFASYTFGFFIDPVLPMIDDQTIDIGSGDPPTLFGDFCGDGTGFGDGCSGISNSRSLTAPSEGTLTSAPIIYDPVTTEDVQLILTLDGTGTNSTGATLFGSFGSVTGVSPIPEPSLLAVVLVLGFLMAVKHYKLKRLG
jgi:hypothetical protein